MPAPINWNWINKDQAVSDDGRFFLNRAEWYDPDLLGGIGGTRHGWTLTIDGDQDGGKFTDLRHVEVHVSELIA